MMGSKACSGCGAKLYLRDGKLACSNHCMWDIRKACKRRVKESAAARDTAAIAALAKDLEKFSSPYVWDKAALKYVAYRLFQACWRKKAWKGMK